MTMLGDIGGLYDFFVLLIHPIVGIIVGDRLTYFLLSKLFIINTARNNVDDINQRRDSEDASDASDPEEKKK